MGDDGVGFWVGFLTGRFVTGELVITAVGTKVGGLIGDAVGMFVGDADGNKVGSEVGDDDVGFWVVG